MDINTVDPETLLTDYSMVFQDVVLFDDTVLENIRLGKHGATDEEVRAAAKAANCDEFVNKLPDGYNTPIGENGNPKWEVTCRINGIDKAFTATDSSKKKAKKKAALEMLNYVLKNFDEED